MSEENQSPATEDSAQSILAVMEAEAKTFRERIEERTIAVLSWLKENDVDYVNTEYDGCGDSGDVNIVRLKLRSDENDATTKADDTYENDVKLTEAAAKKLCEIITPEIISHLELASEMAKDPAKVTAAIGHLCWDWSILVAGDGWYNNEGGHGEVTLFPFRDESRVVVSHSHCVTVYEDTTEEAL